MKEAFLSPHPYPSRTLKLGDLFFVIISAFASNSIITTVEHVILSGENDTVCHFRSRTRPKGGREAGSIMPIINIIFVRDPKQCFALFDPRFARISADAQDDTDESARAKPKRDL